MSGSIPPFLHTTLACKGATLRYENEWQTFSGCFAHGQGDKQIGWGPELVWSLLLTRIIFEDSARTAQKTLRLGCKDRSVSDV